jgi:hypothetical protein
MEEEGVDDTSDALAMRHLTFLMGEYSLGDSKSDVRGVELVAIASTSLVEVSSSALSLLEYSFESRTQTLFASFWMHPSSRMASLVDSRSCS